MFVNELHVLHPKSSTIIRYNDRTYYSFLAAYNAVRTGKYDEFAQKSVKYCLKYQHTYAQIPGWINMRKTIVHRLVYNMLKSNKDCLNALLNTGEEDIIVRGSNLYLCQNDSGVGKNTLGIIYMSFRDVFSFNLGRNSFDEIRGRVTVKHIPDGYYFDYGDRKSFYSNEEAIIGCVACGMPHTLLDTVGIDETKDICYTVTKIDDLELAGIVEDLEDSHSVIELLSYVLKNEGYSRTVERLNMNSYE